MPPDDLMQERDARSLPSALDIDMYARLHGRAAMVFLDYDGTLCPIVERPEDAYLSALTAEALHRVAEHCPVAVLSGRDLWDVREKVGIANVAYAGSHGFDFMTVDGAEWNHPEVEHFVPILNRAESELRQRTRGIAGAQIERKRFSLSAHYRRVGRADLSRFEVAVMEVIGKHRGLHHTLGKMVHDLRPAIDWDKGKALQAMRARLLATEQRPGRPLTIYIGDDRTDEDAFAVLGQDDLGIVLATPSYPTRARYTLADSDAVRGFLGRIADVLQARSAAA